MAQERCSMCSRVNLASLDRCACGSPYGAELTAMTGPHAQQLTRAWLSLGLGGLSLFLVSALTLGHMAWSSLATCIAGLGGLLVVRGARVVSKTGAHLLAAGSLAALPPARVMPSRGRTDTDADDTER
jgi:hypothetical protein